MGLGPYSKCHTNSSPGVYVPNPYRYDPQPVKVDLTVNITKDYDEDLFRIQILLIGNWFSKNNLKMVMF